MLCLGARLLSRSIRACCPIAAAAYMKLLVVHRVLQEGHLLAHVEGEVLLAGEHLLTDGAGVRGRTGRLPRRLEAGCKYRRPRVVLVEAFQRRGGVVERSKVDHLADLHLQRVHGFAFIAFAVRRVQACFKPAAQLAGIEGEDSDRQILGTQHRHPRFAAAGTRVRLPPAARIGTAACLPRVAEDQGAGTDAYTLEPRACRSIACSDRRAMAAGTSRLCRPTGCRLRHRGSGGNRFRSSSRDAGGRGR